MDAKKRRLLLKIVPYPIIFMLGGIVYLFIEKGLLGSTTIYPATGVAYNLVNSIFTIIPMTAILGLILGFMEEVVFRNRFKRMRFSFKILIQTFLYLSLFLVIQFVFALWLNMTNLGKSQIDAEVVRSVLGFYESFTIISITFYAGAIIGLSLFFSEIADYLGMDVAGNFFSGKYSKPVQEERIFMFLDMKDSTTIAEKIGHQKQHELINEYYGDMSDAIVLTHGSIYQYVGDEIVVSWSLEDGLRNANCIECFFQIEERISKRSSAYELKYGTVPRFKAGFHCGEVTRGQVGKIKRDLLYIGDVLNATARIQGLCNQLGANLLISGKLKKLLPENSFQTKPMGELELRGRQKKEELFAVSDRSD